jgi:hypothetical protein
MSTFQKNRKLKDEVRDVMRRITTQSIQNERIAIGLNGIYGTAA